MTEQKNGGIVFLMAKEKTRYPDFGVRLQRARIALGYKTAKSFAERLGLVAHTYRNYERGGRGPDPDDLLLFRYAGINIDYLITGFGAVLIVQTIRKVS